MKNNETWVSPFVADGPTQASAKVYEGCLELAPSGERDDERYACLRSRVGLSDSSHFGKFRFSGDNAMAAVNQLVLSDVSRLPVRRMMVTFVLNSEGKAVADAYVVNEGSSYLLFSEGVAPSAMASICASVDPNVTVTDLTRKLALLSVDGPFAWELLKDLVGVSILGARFLDAISGLSIADIPTTVYRAGKTGEFGYLLQVDSDQAQVLLAAVCEVGSRYRALICCQDDIDLCKLENRVVNMSREGGSAESVLELNTRVMVCPDKDDYLGREIIESSLRKPELRRLIGVRCDVAGRELAEGAFCEGAGLYYKGTRIGEIANARYSPALDRWIAVGFMNPAYAYVGLDYEAEGGLPVRTVSAPFITNKSVQIRPQEDSFFAQEVG